jgi:hypothetical protein
MKQPREELPTSGPIAAGSALMYLPTMKSAVTLRISSWKGVKSFN